VIVKIDIHLSVIPMTCSSLSLFFW